MLVNLFRYAHRAQVGGERKSAMDRSLARPLCPSSKPSEATGAVSAARIRPAGKSITASERRGKDQALKAALEAEEREREQIALELQDGAIQLVASAFQQVQAARDGGGSDEQASGTALAKASGLLKESMSELRALVDRLRPATLERFGLIASLESDIQKLRQGGWDAYLIADPVRSPKGRETSLYRIIHEALANVRKHAGVCRLWVTLKRNGAWLDIEISDEGLGFSPAAAERRKSQGFGLLSMRKRAELLGGTFDLTSELGQGTRITVCVPMRRKGD